MSEEILKALMQLFALISKQDGGVEENEKTYVRNFLSQQIANQKVDEYYSLFEEFAGLSDEQSRVESGKQKLTSVIDSVRVLGICKKINKTLNQGQKAVVLVRLFELVNSATKFTPQRMAIITAAAEVFKISKPETESIEKFIHAATPEDITDSNVLVVNDLEIVPEGLRQIRSELLDGHIFILYIPGVELYFLKYKGREEIFLNGLPVAQNRIYLFASGSTIKLPKGKPLYYSDISADFLHEQTAGRISFNADHISYKFPNGVLGIKDISFTESQGNLVGIMGASGSGKTTLLSILSGLAGPSQGRVLINGLNLYEDKDDLQGVIGLIPQDDLLIEELTVYQNIFYNAKLCFRDLPDSEISRLAEKTLNSLGLFETRDLKVGSPFNKFISGGQRKRLNIALELIREPSILFVDEPTSGLSSKDSENVMDLLRELALKGKLVFVVIHQPSSEIYKMFDKIIFLDTGGYLIYYGNPVEAVMYFKRKDAQINADIGECPVCGSVNPELIFNIIESRVVDEFGNYVNERKVPSEKWAQLFAEEQGAEEQGAGSREQGVKEIQESPPKTLRIPVWPVQFIIYFIRDFLSKTSNRQYVLFTLLEAPVLGLMLSYIIRYIADPSSRIYVFRENENIPIYIFMSLIVALFLGLIVSAEEIFRDRKLLKREAFLNLSRSSYLLSKTSILFLISAIQTITFVIIGNSILGIKGMTFAYWFALFTTSACANMIGLNVSASFNSAITIYIIIPLIMIPMMVLSGAMFPFDKLNRSVGSVEKVPVIAEIMPTKWSYEALMVNQFKNNRFQKQFNEIKKAESMADFKQVYLLPELNDRFDKIKEDFQDNSVLDATAGDLKLIQNEVIKELYWVSEITFDAASLVPENMSDELLDSLGVYLKLLDDHYTREFVKANNQRENMILYFMEEKPGMYNSMKDMYHNESVEEHVRKVFEKHKMVEYRYNMIQQIDPIYKDPFPRHSLSFFNYPAQNKALTNSPYLKNNL